MDRPPGKRLAVVESLQEAGTTVIQCTARPGAFALDGWLWLGREQQIRFASAAELAAHVKEREDRLKGAGRVV